jgi:hypothetical protein
MQPRTDPERQIEQARESLVAHLGELGQRFKSVRTRLDLRAKIAAHPLPSVGVAFALGALLGMRGGGKRGEADQPGFGRLALAALGALGVRLAKELAMRRAADAARGWWERRQQAASSEFRTSYEPGVEPFLRR